MERPRRVNAGSRMTKLIEEAQDEEDADDAEFYKSTYGGFNEDEEDNDYQSEEEQEDIVDSDFSLSEQEDETKNEEEDDDKKRRKKNKIIFKKTAQSTAPKTKKPYVKKIAEPVLPLDKQARMRSSTLQKGAQVTARQQHVQGAGIKRHPTMPQMRRLTQEELLAEAKITEQKNTASLAQFLKLEEEKKNVKVTKTRYQGPTIRFQSVRMPEFVDVTENVEGHEKQFVCRNFLEFSDTTNFPKHYFPHPSKVRYPEKPVCVVTGRLAKYRDPITGLSYSTIDAFKYIRQHQQKLQEKMSKVRLEGATRKRKKVSLY